MPTGKSRHEIIKIARLHMKRHMHTTNVMIFRERHIQYMIPRMEALTATCQECMLAKQRLSGEEGHR